ncbi:MAG: DUF4234 domain-containing protein [Aeromonas sp.]
MTQNNQANENDLKFAVNMQTLHFVLLTIVTGGIYPILWIYKYTAIIENLTKSTIADKNYAIWLSVCVGLSGVFIGIGDDTAMVIGGLLSLGPWILNINWAFKARTAIQDYALSELKIDYKMNGFYTALVTLYYINYCINDLPEAKRRQMIINSYHQQQQSTPQQVQQ